jgi:polysaccharide export outer membrane protein
MVKTVLVVALALAAAQESSKGERANYVVGPGDVLAVHVFYEPQLSGSFRVENDGHFGYPFLGRVSAAGNTVGSIAVDVEQFRSQSVFVMGEVRTPGKYTLSGSVTLLDALAQAGSPTPAAGAEVLILHPTTGPTGAPTLPNQRDAEVTRVNLREIEDGRLSRNATVRDGDTVFVPKAERFFVIGMVRNPGSYVLERNMTVLQAISTAGGISERGSNRRLKIVRIVDNKRKELDADPTDVVSPGDTIVVRQRLL